MGQGVKAFLLNPFIKKFDKRQKQMYVVKFNVISRLSQLVNIENHQVYNWAHERYQVLVWLCFKDNV